MVIIQVYPVNKVAPVVITLHHFTSAQGGYLRRAWVSMEMVMVFTPTGAIIESSQRGNVALIKFNATFP